MHDRRRWAAALCRASSRGVLRFLVAACLAWSGFAPASGQDKSVDTRLFSVKPYASLTEVLTDNVTLTPQKRSDLVTLPSVGFHALANSARLKGFVDYSLTGLVYARGSGRRNFQNALNAAVTADVIENRAGVELFGNVSQQAISAFGVQSPSTSLINPNQTTVSSFAVSPYLHGRLGDVADYEARLRYADTRSSDAPLSNNTVSSQSLRLGDATAGRKLNWSARLLRETVDYKEGRRTEGDTLRGTLTWNFTRELAASVIGGAESTNYVTPDKEAHTIYGLGLKWQPSPRTALAGEVERRFFGHSHDLTFSYRTARSVWTFTDVRDVSTNTGALFGTLGNAYDLFFQQFASVEPDLVLRRQLVDSFLMANGIDPTATAIARYLNSGVTLQRLQNLSFAWLGLRDTVSVSFSQSEQRQLNALPGAGAEISGVTRVRQHGLLASLSHRLTPLSTLALALSQQRATGVLPEQSNTLRSVGAVFTMQVGRRSDLSIAARHAAFSSTSTPYNENALLATFRTQF